MNYYKAENTIIKDEANRLLYHALWAPPGMAANAREDFKTDGVEYILSPPIKVILSAHLCL